MAKQSCQVMLEDLLYDAIDSCGADRNVNPRMMAKFVDTCMRPEPRGGLGRRRQRRRKAKR